MIRSLERDQAGGIGGGEGQEVEQILTWLKYRLSRYVARTRTRIKA